MRDPLSQPGPTIPDDIGPAWDYPSQPAALLAAGWTPAVGRAQRDAARLIELVAQGDARNLDRFLTAITEEGRSHAVMSQLAAQGAYAMRAVAVMSGNPADARPVAAQNRRIITARVNALKALQS